MDDMCYSNAVKKKFIVICVVNPKLSFNSVHAKTDILLIALSLSHNLQISA